MKPIKQWIWAVAAAGGAFLPTQNVHAETIPVHGVYAGQVAIPAEVEIIEVEDFHGDLGRDVEFALVERLGNVTIRGQRWFDLLSPRDLQTAYVEVEGSDGTVTRSQLVADARLRGTVHSEAFEREVEPKKKRECVARDEDGGCTERRDVFIECLELTVRVEPRIQLIASNGEQYYSHNRPREQSERFCADENSVPSILEKANSMVDDIAEAIRRDIAPRERQRNIRVMERRRDLRREDRDPFREAVRATTTSIEAACTGFEALETSNPTHSSVLFNIGLCYESGGQLEEAADYYRKILELDPGRDYPQDGLRRIRSRQLAESMIAAREQGD